MLEINFRMKDRIQTILIENFLTSILMQLLIRAIANA